MCDHHHAARHILCPQCDLLVALPQLEHRQKAVCPRCGTTLTTSWDAPRQRPTAYALVALFMLLLANLFPFVDMQVSGLSSEIKLLEIPGVLFSEDYLLFTLRTAGARFLSGHHSATGQPHPYAARVKGVSGAHSVSPQNLGNGGDFPRRGAGELRQADGIR